MSSQDDPEMGRRCLRPTTVIVPILLAVLLHPVVPVSEAFSPVPVPADAVHLKSPTQVHIGGPISTYASSRVERDGWSDDDYFLDVVGEGGNKLHVILQFYLFPRSQTPAEYYLVRVFSRTEPNPDDLAWKLDSGGPDDPNGPANYMVADAGNATLIEWNLANNLYGPTIKCALTSCQWEERQAGGSHEFWWTLGLNSSEGERSSFTVEYYLILLVARGSTAHLNVLRFEGNLWYSAWYHPLAEHLMVQINELTINYNGLHRPENSSLSPNHLQLATGSLIPQSWVIPASASLLVAFIFALVVDLHYKWGLKRSGAKHFECKYTTGNIAPNFR